MTKTDRVLFESLLAALGKLTGGSAVPIPTPTAPVTPPAPSTPPAQATALPAWVQEVLRKADIPMPTTPSPAPVTPPEKKPEPPFATLAELVAYRAERKAPPLLTPDRPWSFVGYDASGSDNLTMVFQAPQKNGGWFRSTYAIDLVNAIRRGTVAGMPR